ncbi:MAG: Na/Pi cotransporter family protein [Bacteroidota bacterium]|nr:Na/Pi cotransporter family protein [Bacteroidota bacterium]
MSFLSVFWDGLTLVGALGLFLFGMKLMSEALQKVAGGRMQEILGAMTNNRLKGVLTGILVTTTIQSSSATTVMVVSFVNAGLLSLIAAVGVIMGANIGTTVTAWIISLLGFKVSLSFLSLPLIGLSFPLFFSKNGNRKSWGEFVIGFAILFIGLQFLKDAVPDIRNNPEALNFLSSFTDLGFLSTLLFVAIGTVLTIIIQSSSATMALTLVMCYNGLIPFELAAAMVLGENIGTTVTANIAALVANVSARRTARAHLIFNIFGVVWILLIFPYFLEVIDYIVVRNHGVSILDGDISADDFEKVKTIYPIGLSLFHTVFNILNTLLLLGFAKQIAMLATKMVPDKEDEDEEFRLRYINTGMLSTSEMSLMQAQNEISNFGARIEKMYGFIPKLLKEDKPKKVGKILARIKKYEQITDNMELEIASYLTQVSEGEMSHKSSKKVRTMFKIIDDMESAADVMYRLSITIDTMKQRKISLPLEQQDNIDDMIGLVNQSFNVMNKNIETNFEEVDSKSAIELENSINEKRNALRYQHVDDLKAKKYKHKVGSVYSDLFSLNEKIGDYVINVTEAIDEGNVD